MTVKGRDGEVLAGSGVNGETGPLHFPAGRPVAGVVCLDVTEGDGIGRRRTASVIMGVGVVGYRATPGLNEHGAGGMVVKADDFRRGAVGERWGYGQGGGNGKGESDHGQVHRLTGELSRWMVRAAGDDGKFAFGLSGHGESPVRSGPLKKGRAGGGDIDDFVPSARLGEMQVAGRSLPFGDGNKAGADHGGASGVVRRAGRGANRASGLGGMGRSGGGKGGEQCQGKKSHGVGSQS